jgi:acetyl-CoA acetyltransferase
MREAVVVASSRTGLAKSFRGSFNITCPEDLAAHCIKDVLRKVPQLDAAEIDDVVLGCAQPHGPQSHNIARTSAAALLYGALKPFVASLERVRLWNAAHSG